MVLSQQLLDAAVWSDDQLAAEGIPIVDSTLVTVGGGLGSFALVQALRIAGVSPSEISVLTPTVHPFDAFRQRAEAAQLTSTGPLRSPSDAAMDNFWGFPGYALRRFVHDRSIGPLWRVLIEPVFGEYFTPQCRELYDGMKREAGRLGWSEMVSLGLVEHIRRRREGGYLVLQRCGDSSGRHLHVAHRCRYVHLAVGSPGPRMTAALAAYRGRFPSCRRLVQTYEPHEHVYAALREASGTVIVRGAGITASHILERLIEDRRASGCDTRIVHIARTPTLGPHGPRRWRRDGGHGFSYQPFNFPKAAFGGQLKAAAERLDETARTTLIADMARTSTPRRKRWTDQIEEGLRAGWYWQIPGEITTIDRDEGGIAMEVRQPDGVGAVVRADFLIDATGLENEPARNPLLADLVESTGAGLTAQGRLAVTPSFEVRGTRHDPGRIYASGMLAGGAYGPVDSFLGLQYAALTIADDLADLGWCRRIGVRRSVRQWWRWMRDRAP